MEKYIGVRPGEKKRELKQETPYQSAMETFEQQMRVKPSHMFLSGTERQGTSDESSPGPQHYADTAVHLRKKDFSRPRIVIASPTRNCDGAFRTDPYLASNELRDRNLSPGPAAARDYPGAARDRAKQEPRMRQYGLNMIAHTI